MALLGSDTESRILEAALARGWLEAADLSGDAAEVSSDGPTAFTGSWGPRIEALLRRGRLDKVALAALAEELGLLDAEGDHSTAGLPPPGASRAASLGT
jgi:hypothetical protein